MLQKKSSLLLAFLGIFFFSGKALAVCPICTIAVGAGVGLSRYLGIDDTITGLWIGGLIVSLTMWTINWLRKKEINFKGRNLLTVLGYYLLMIAPLYFSKIIGHPYNTIWGLDKLLFGIIAGSIFFFLGAWSYDLIKKKRGRAHFPFQKIVMPILPLIIFSIIFYFLTKL
jgi:hypothetical protein